MSKFVLCSDTKCDKTVPMTQVTGHTESCSSTNWPLNGFSNILVKFNIV
jgi:hypothetical protein